MSINYYQFQTAVVHLSSQMQTKRPNTDLYLTKANLHYDSSISAYSGWKLCVDAPVAIEPFQPGVTFITFVRPVPILVKFDELSDEPHNSIRDIYINVFNLDRALEVADYFIKNNEEISEAFLFRLRSLGTLEVNTWKLTYSCLNHLEEYIPITVTVAAHKSEFVSAEIE